jgi:hypothetical protein
MEATLRRVPLRRALTWAAWLALAAAAAGCSGSSHGPGAGSRQSPPPQPQQAYAIARKEFGLLAGGGWAQAWSLWTASAQHAVPQAEFVRVNTACRPLVGVPYTIDNSTVDNATTVRIAWHRGAATGSSTMLYQAGQWRFGPDAGTLADYRLGADALVRHRRAAGSCH